MAEADILRHVGGVIENNDAFACEAAADLPQNHCINVRSKGKTGLIIVLDGDPRWPAEGISFDPKANDRPCPHDPGSSDGTWWTPPNDDPGDGPLWVCHHKP